MRYILFCLLMLIGCNTTNQVVVAPSVKVETLEERVCKQAGPYAERVKASLAGVSRDVTRVDVSVLACKLSASETSANVLLSVGLQGADGRYSDAIFMTTLKLMNGAWKVWREQPLTMEDPNATLQWCSETPTITPSAGVAPEPSKKTFDL